MNIKIRNSRGQEISAKIFSIGSDAGIAYCIEELKCIKCAHFVFDYNTITDYSKSHNIERKNIESDIKNRLNSGELKVIFDDETLEKVEKHKERVNKVEKNV